LRKGDKIFVKRSLKFLKSIGKELREIRNEKKMHIKDIAEKAGVSQMYISEIERDKKIPSDEVIFKLSEIYGVNASDLFEGFQRIPEAMEDEILSSTELFDVLYNVSTNKNIPEEVRKKLYFEIKALHDRMLKDYL
jgi:transcriptional regulator with XRE-family HTH domain